MRLFKKYLSAVLSAAMMIAMVPCTAAAESDGNSAVTYTVSLETSNDSVEAESIFTVNVVLEGTANETAPAEFQTELSFSGTGFSDGIGSCENTSVTYDESSSTLKVSYSTDSESSGPVFDDEGKMIVAKLSFTAESAGTEAVVELKNAVCTAADSSDAASVNISSVSGKVSVLSLEPESAFTGEITEIYTEKDLIQFAQSVNNGTDYEEKTIKLYSDIQMSSEWNPIGNGTHPFKGTFDGQGHTISGISMNITDSYPKDECEIHMADENQKWFDSNYAGLGLFGIVSDAVIRNIETEGQIEFTYCQSGLNSKDKISICAGGIVGLSMDGECSISNCINRINISVECTSTKVSVGGIAGYLGLRSDNKEIVVSGCRNYGEITGHLTNDKDPTHCSYLGGVVGKAGNAYIKCCDEYGDCNIENMNFTVKKSGNYGSIKMNSFAFRGVGNVGKGQTPTEDDYVDYEILHGYAGGVIGCVIGTGTVCVEECFNKGEISGWNKFTGGIAGGVYNAALKNCYNTGNISVEGDGKVNNLFWEASLAGIVGVAFKYIYASNTTYATAETGQFSLLNCYNGGTIDDSKIADGYGKAYPLYGKLLSYETMKTLGQESPSSEENCYTYDDVADNIVTAEAMGDAFKADSDNVQAGLPLLVWEETESSSETCQASFKVQNSEEELLEGAEVHVYTKSDMLPDSEVTTQNGIFELKTGIYYYTVSAEGYIDVRGSFKVNGIDVQTVVVLKEKAEVTVSVTPANAAVTLVTSGGETVQPKNSDEGVYTYTLYQGATYTCTAFADGFSSISKQFTAEKDSELSINLAESEYGANDQYVYGDSNEGKTHEITAGGIYSIGEGAAGVMTVNTTEPVILIGRGTAAASAYEELYIDCLTEGTDLTLQNVFISNEGGASDPKMTNMIDFTGKENYLRFSGTSMLDQNTGATGYAMVHVNQDTELTIGGVTEADTLYFYKREQGAGIGGNGGASGGEGQTAETNGKITITGGNLFMKNSKQGALIGAGAQAGTQKPGDIVIEGGVLNLAAMSRGGAIGGSAGSNGASSGSNVYLNGGTVTINVDWSGAAIGGGGYDGGNDADGGTLYYQSGSLRTFIDQNAISSWNVSEPGVNRNKAVTADIVDGEGQSLYLLELDTGLLTGEGSSTEETYTVKEGSRTVYSGGLHQSEFICAYDASADSTITSTMDNWESLEDSHLYLYLTGEDHVLDVNGQTVKAVWNAETKDFELKAGESLEIIDFGGNYSFMKYEPIEGTAYTYDGKAMYAKDGAFYCVTAKDTAADRSLVAPAESGMSYDDVIKGDINENGVMNIVDAQIVYDISSNVYSGFEQLTSDQIVKADANNDLFITAADARTIQYLIHGITE